MTHASTMPAPPEPQERMGSDYAELSRRISRAGLMRRRSGRYVVRMAVVFGLLAAAWAGFAVLGDSWWTLLFAAGLGVLFTQIGFLGHDVGHRQVFTTKRAADRFGLVAGNLLIGLGYGWWIDKHTRHHANPNHEEKDPDVAPGAIRWTQRQAIANTGLGRAVTRWQAFLFFPMLLLEGLNLHVSSIRAVLQRRTKRAVLEVVLLTAHLVGNVAAAFIVLSPGKAVLFLAIQQAVFGLYMGCSFAPNHKGMPMLGPDDKLDYLRKQVLTARNVAGGPIVDTLLGGLNYQIEHHLFPSMPKPNLRHAQPIVRAFCAEHDVSYTETSALTSYVEALRSLHEAGAPLRQPATAATPDR
jgi:fatty acid desaturase